MKKYRFTMGTLFFLGTCFQSLHAQTAPTLQEILDSALTHDYSYENKQLSLKSIELDRERLNDVYMPRVELNAKEAYLFAAANLTTPEFAFTQLPIPLPLVIPEHENRYQIDNFMTQADLKATFVLFAGGKVGYLKKANEARLEAETALVNTDRNGIVQNVSAVYDQLSMLKAVKAMLDESQKRLDENTKTARKALENGLITQYEYNKVNLAQAQLQSKYKEYEGKRRLVLLNLNMLTKIPMERLEKIDEDLQVMTIAYVDAPQNRPELTALNAAVRANEYKVKAAKTWWIPKLGASASVSYLGLQNPRIRTTQPTLITQEKINYTFNNFNAAPIFTAGVGLKWDLFDGREGITETKKAQLDLQIAKNKLEDANEKIQLQLEKNKVELEVASEQLNVRQIALQIAENSMDQAMKEFKIGLIKSTQLLEAENDLQQAKLDFSQAVFQQRRAAVNYLEAAGILNSTTLK